MKHSSTLPWPLYAMVGLTVWASAGILAPAAGATITVSAGQSIQSAVARANPGDRIDVMPGLYHETVYIDRDRIELHGMVRAGQWPILDGEGTLDDGILAAGHDVTIEGMWVKGFKGNGIMTQGSNNFRIIHNVVEGPCFYAIFPQFGKNGIVAYNVVSKSEDAAIYIGMSDNVDVTHNEASQSILGIETENSRNILIESNYVHDNVLGIATTLLPGLPVKTADNLVLRYNFVIDNNRVNSAPAGAITAGSPSGLGILVLGTDDTIIEGNVIRGNNGAGILVGETNFFVTTHDDKMDPFPDNDKILGNLFVNNGSSPSGTLKELLEVGGRDRGVDVLATGKGHDNCISDRASLTTLGTDRFTDCQPSATSAKVTSMQTAQPVVAPTFTAEQKGRLTYLAVCSGCHTYNSKLTGPPMITIKALYGQDARRLADWIANPVHKRPDYPAMPTQNYLPDDIRMAVAGYILNELNH